MGDGYLGDGMNDYHVIHISYGGKFGDTEQIGGYTSPNSHGWIRGVINESNI